MPVRYRRVAVGAVLTAAAVSVPAAGFASGPVRRPQAGPLAGRAQDQVRCRGDQVRCRLAAARRPRLVRRYQREPA
jgi:hypothetical protein